MLWLTQNTGATRRTMRTTRHQSWQNFVSSINSRTSLKRVRNMINKISAHTERQPLKFNSNNTETHNIRFSVDQMLDALSNSNDLLLARTISTIRFALTSVSTLVRP